MPTILYFLVALTLNAQTGEMISRKAISGPMEASACAIEQVSKIPEHTDMTANPPTIVVYRCDPLQGEGAT